MAYAMEEERTDEHRRSTGVLALFGLAVFAVSFPLVRVLVDAPEFFIAHDLTGTATAVFFVVVILVVPAVLALVGSLPGAVGRVMQFVVLGILSVLAAAGLLQPISGLSALFVVAVLALAVTLVAAEVQRGWLRSMGAVLLVLPVLLLAWTLGPSRVGSYIRSSDATVLAQKASKPVDTPVVVVVFDEFPLTALLDHDLHINSDRFPNLAALADTSSWFRTASSISPQTSASVPALLSGMEPDLTKVPVASAYPSNIFLQLGNLYEAHDYQPITSLCPDSVCGAGAASKAGSKTKTDDDALLVYRHAVSSDAMRADLPSISQGWAGFGGSPDADLVDAAAADETPKGGYGTFPAQVGELQSLLAQKGHTDRPQLWVAHLIAPHMPWVAVPDGTTYAGAVPPGLTVEGGTLTWGQDEAQRRAGYQRLLLQIGALDREVGAMRQELEQEGIWDDAVVVVTADHGVQFEPGGSRAVGAGGAEVTGVPLFVKAPHQTKGRIDDRAALTMDVVPTVLGQIGLQSPSKFDGLDLFTDRIPDRRTDAFLVGAGSTTTPDQSLDALRKVVERRSKWLDPDGGWDPVFQVGVQQQLVGTSVASLGAATPSDAAWHRTEGETGRRVTIEWDAAPPSSSTALVVCDGTVAGAADTSQAGPVTVFAAPDHCSEPDRGEVWILDSDGAIHQARRS